MWLDLSFFAGLKQSGQHTWRGVLPFHYCYGVVVLSVCEHASMLVALVSDTWLAPLRMNGHFLMTAEAAD